MKWVDIFERVTPSWSAEAGFSGAAGTAQSEFCEIHLQTLWVYFAQSGAPDDRNTNETMRAKVEFMHDKNKP